MASNPTSAVFEVAGIQRKPAAKSFVPREVRASIVARLREHGHPPGRVARSVGMSASDVVGILIEESELERRSAYTRGLAEGRLSAAFPLKPIGAQRRAA